MRDLQRARSAKFPAQELPSVSNKRKTARPFFDSRLFIRLRAVAVRGTSVYPSLPHFCFAKMRSCFAKVRHGIPAVHCMKQSSPCRNCRASPITKRAINAALCVLTRNCSRLSYFVFISERMKYESLRTDKRKRFSTVFSHMLFCRIRTSPRAYRPSSVRYISPLCLRGFRKTLRPCFRQRR